MRAYYNGFRVGSSLVRSGRNQTLRYRRKHSIKPRHARILQGLETEKIVVHFNSSVP